MVGFQSRSQKTFLKGSFPFWKVCRQMSGGGALSSSWGFGSVCRQGGGDFGSSTRQCFADRCLRMSSLLPAVRRQVPAPSANKLGPDPRDCAFLSRPPGIFFHPIQEHDPTLILKLENTKSVASFSFQQFAVYRRAPHLQDVLWILPKVNQPVTSLGNPCSCRIKGCSWHQMVPIYTHIYTHVYVQHHKETFPTTFTTGSPLLPTESLQFYHSLQQERKIQQQNLKNATQNILTPH